MNASRRSSAFAVVIAGVVTAVRPFALTRASTCTDPAGGGATFCTFTVIGNDVVDVPVESVARTANVWLPLATVVESKGAEYGGAVKVPPSGWSSSRNCTDVMPFGDDADAVTFAVPATVLPADGAVIEAVGADNGAPIRIIEATDGTPSPFRTNSM
jgi:hypothetical protein